MGWFWGTDKEASPEAHSNSTLTSNVTIGHTVDIASDQILALLCIITIIKLIELLLHLYRTMTRNHKRKYTQRSESKIQL